MADFGKQVSINELRAGKVRDNLSFGKSLFGGYSVKEVTEYIRTLKDSLSNAETSFKSRLEEYSTMTSMLTQERDKYKSALSESENANVGLNNKIIEINTELEELREKVSELSEDSATQEEIKRYETVIEENEQYKEIIKNHENYAEENEELKQKIKLMELTIEDLNQKLDIYAENEVTREQYDIIAAENELIEQKYDEIVTQHSILLAEKNILTENNNRLAESLNQAYDKVKELRDINTKTKLNARKIMAEYETRAYECGQNHKRNIEQISESIKSALNGLRYEQTDIMKLLSHSHNDFELEAPEDLGYEDNSVKAFDIDDEASGDIESPNLTY